MNFAENLMALRKQRGWSQEELGSQIGVTRQTVSKWEMGQSTPELEKLVELSRLFCLSLDQLVGLEQTGEGTAQQKTTIDAPEARSLGVVYEYISSVKVFGLPLIHIRYGLTPKLAKGIIAIGDCAVGVVAVGGASLGIVSLGGISVGLLFALGGCSLGLISLGGLAIGGFAIGGCAVGQWLAAGGGAFSNYLAIGGGAFSKGLAIGGSASGHIAVGVNGANGMFTYLRGQREPLEQYVEWVWLMVKDAYPLMWDWVKGMVQWALS